MGTKNDGGSAFPLPSEIRESHFSVRDAYAGMSLRDYFAATAMQGMASRPQDQSEAEMAADAYEIADAMLAERAK